MTVHVELTARRARSYLRETLLHLTAHGLTGLCCKKSTLFLWRKGAQRRDRFGAAFFVHSYHGEKQLFTWRLAWVWMFSAITLMPTSMEDVPVWLTDAMKVTSSPT